MGCSWSRWWKFRNKGSHNPQKTKIFIYQPILTKIYGKVVWGTSAMAPVRSWEKGVGPPKKSKFSVFRYTRNCNIFVYQRISTKFDTKVVLMTLHIRKVEVPGKRVRQGSNSKKSEKNHVFWHLPISKIFYYYPITTKVYTKIEVGTAHVTVVSIPEKGELWSTYEEVNVPATADVQQVSLSELIRSAQQKFRGRIETVRVTVVIVCKSLYRLVKTARRSVENWLRYKQKTGAIHCVYV
jgi:hypothetical protein